ncbi:MAG: Deoxyguanosinetriphosphate triphosphohydrolase-like protein [Planctomycetes bacterium]|nr:Deoxyguanosinetriphosphate triphosphohydrolase-like protein [Planctomycetota bacterium]
MRTRADIEAAEDRALAPYGMRAARSRGRLHPEAEHPYRTAYQRDRDRVIHCAAFRRLEAKTQVFVNLPGHEAVEGHHTRLTHTIEVAQIARTVARALGLNEDLTETLALVHDLGHAPFGHAGEHALADCARSRGGFEHNAHGLRIVQHLERRYPSFPGLNLSYETLEGMAKHGDYLAKGSAALFRPDERPLLEAAVADRADRLAYNHHDLDDALSSGVLTEKDVREMPHVDRAFAAVDAAAPGLPLRVRVNQVFIALMNEAVTDLVTATSRRIESLGIAGVDDVRRAAVEIVGYSDDGERRQEAMHRFLFARFYTDPRVTTMQREATRALTDVFESFVRSPETLPGGDPAARGEDILATVRDHVASMTDRELLQAHRRLRG